MTRTDMAAESFHNRPLPIPGGVCQCDGCGYWQPVESVTVVSLRGQQFRWCPVCDHQRMKHPEETVTRKAAR
jgi:hypothetical protein